MRKLIAIGLLALLSGAAQAQTTCPAGSAFELRRPSDNSPLGCIDNGGRLKIASTTINSVDQNWPSANGASNTFLRNDGSGNLTWAASGAGASSVAYPYMGVNYRAEGGIPYSTGTSSFHIPSSTYIFNGATYNVADTSFSMVNSTFAIVAWNPTNGHRKYGINNFTYINLSSFTATFADDIIVAASSSGSTGNISVFDTAWSLSEPGIAYVSDSNVGAVTIANKPDSFFNCQGGTQLSYASCFSNTWQQKPIGRSFDRQDQDTANAPAEHAEILVVYVDTAATSSITCGADTAAKVGISTNTNAGVFTSVALDFPDVTTYNLSGNAYTTIFVRGNSNTTSGGETANYQCWLGKAVRVVRGGF